MVETMKVKLVMRDIEYRDALAKRWSKTGSNLYVEIGEEFVQDENEIIITDVGYGKLKPGMIYLHPEPRREVEGIGPHTLFKYAGAESLLRDINICFYLWTGQGTLPDGHSFILLLGAESRTDLCHQYAFALSQELGRQSELSVLYLPLTYFIPEIAVAAERDAEACGTIRKLGYYLEQKREISPEMFFHQYSNQVYQLRSLNNKTLGINELTQITNEEQMSFIENVSKYFDITVLMVGDYFNKNTVELMQLSDRSIFLGSNRITDAICNWFYPMDTDSCMDFGATENPEWMDKISIVSENERELLEVQAAAKLILEKI